MAHARTDRVISSDQARRPDLLDAAEAVFYRRGYAGATIQEIADEFGVLKGSIYHYVRSKTDLLLEVEERLHTTVYAEVKATVDRVDDEVGRIWAYVYAMVKVSAEKPSMGALSKAALELPEGPGRRRILKQRGKFDTLLRDLLTTAQESGAARTDIDTKLAAFGVLGMINSIYVWYRPDGGVSPDALARTFADLVVAGLLPDRAFDSSAWTAPVARTSTA